MVLKMTRRIRLTLSITPELKHALDELNDATGVAAASFVNEIMEGNIPMILGIADAARRAKTDPARALELMQRALLEASGMAHTTQIEMLDAQAKLRTFNRKEEK
jgi:predicted DNA-binding protein